MTTTLSQNVLRVAVDFSLFCQVHCFSFNIGGLRVVGVCTKCLGRALGVACAAVVEEQRASG